jgi:hypothetical protein
MSETRSGVCEATCACGACQGIRDATPVEIQNRPGLSAIRYRVGDHGRFKESLLAGLSRAALPALRGLTTRSDDDFSIALLDAFAVMADVLTFYQERIANESYLRTATERLSLGHIARLIGYELRPGSAAGTSLAFTMQEGAGAVEKLRLPVGTRVQSTPGPEEKAQAFETVEEIEVRPAWNAIPARATQEQMLGTNTTEVRLKGGALNLRPGDAMLLTFATPGGSDFTASFRRVRSVQVEPQGRWTDVSLTSALAAAGFDGLTPPQTGAIVFRKHPSLFGHNAPDFKTLDESKKTPTSAADWTLDASATWADWLTLDGVYKEVVPGTWGLWERPGAVGSPLIFKVITAIEQGISAYALSGKATQINIQRGKNVSTSIVPASFAELRSVSVLAQSEKLELAEVPVLWPVLGSTVAFAEPVEGLMPGRTVAVRGKRLRAEVRKPVTLFLFTPSGVIQKGLKPGDRLDLLYFPIPVFDGAVTWFLVIQDGQLGLLPARPGSIQKRRRGGGAGHDHRGGPGRQERHHRSSTGPPVRPAQRDPEHQRGRGDARGNREGDVRGGRCDPRVPAVRAQADPAHLCGGHDSQRGPLDAPGVGGRGGMARGAFALRPGSQGPRVRHAPGRRGEDLDPVRGRRDRGAPAHGPAQRARRVPEGDRR